MDLTRLIRETREQLTRGEAHILSKKYLLGFDAFVDEISDIVDERQDFQEYTKLHTITDFGTRILEAAGLSNSMEMVPRYAKTGGSAVNMGSAVLELGCTVDYIGAIGYPDVHPVFADFAQRVHGYRSIANPGHTLALEFRDGKIMICNTQPLKDITWERIVGTVGLDTLREQVLASDVVGSINWTMTPYMNEIWRQMQQMLSQQEPAVEKPIFFVDPVDPAKRDNEDIVEAMELLAGFSKHFRVILSLNRKEATEVAKAFQLELGMPLAEAGLERITTELAQALGFYGLVVHPVDRAGCVIDGAYVEAKGPYAENPKLTTGAGDNFNGGFSLGLLLGFEPIHALVLGMAVSGSYVRQAGNPTLAALHDLLITWEQHGEDAF